MEDTDGTQICRICLKEGTGFFALSTNTTPLLMGRSIGETICKLFPEMYPELQFPNSDICTDCLRELESAHMFKSKCVYTEYRIRQYLKNTDCLQEVTLFHIKKGSIEELDEHPMPLTLVETNEKFDETQGLKFYPLTFISNPKATSSSLQKKVSCAVGPTSLPSLQKRKKLASTLGGDKTEEMCKKKVINILATYRREQKKEKPPSGKGSSVHTPALSKKFRFVSGKNPLRFNCNNRNLLAYSVKEVRKSDGEARSQDDERLILNEISEVLDGTQNNKVTEKNPPPLQLTDSVPSLRPLERSVIGSSNIESPLNFMPLLNSSTNVEAGKQDTQGSDITEHEVESNWLEAHSVDDDSCEDVSQIYHDNSYIQNIEDMTGDNSCKEHGQRVTENFEQIYLPAPNETRVTKRTQPIEEIDIKEEPLDLDEVGETSAWFSGGETTRTASETSFYEKGFCNLGLEDLLDDHAGGNYNENLVFDKPDYIKVQKMEEGTFEEYVDRKKLPTGPKKSEPFEWTPELCFDLHNCFKKSKPHIRGFMRRLEKIWAGKHPELRRSGKYLHCQIMAMKRKNVKLTELTDSDDASNESFGKKQEHSKETVRTHHERGARSRKTSLQYKHKENEVYSIQDLIYLRNSFVHTKFSIQGDYIEDHDYLLNPYGRYKMFVRTLVKEENLVSYTWNCCCMICGDVHNIHLHQEHMEKHNSFCEDCHTDFKNAFTLNIHLKYVTHDKYCRLCMVMIPYSQRSHFDDYHGDNPKPETKDNSKTPQEQKWYYDTQTKRFQLWQNVRIGVKGITSTRRRRGTRRRRLPKKLRDVKKEESSHTDECPSKLSELERLLTKKELEDNSIPEMEKGNTPELEGSNSPSIDTPPKKPKLNGTDDKSNKDAIERDEPKQIKQNPDEEDSSQITDQRKNRLKEKQCESLSVPDEEDSSQITDQRKNRLKGKQCESLSVPTKRLLRPRKVTAYTF